MKTAFSRVLDVALAAGCSLALAAPALAHETIARAANVPGGPYTIMVGLMSDPPHVEQPLEITIGAVSGTPTLAGATVTLTGVPGLGTDATPTRPVLMTLEAGEREYFEGKLSLPVRGAWMLRLDVTGPAGKGTALLPITVAAPAALPLWLGWLIAMSPLLGVAWFGWWNRRYYVRLLREARG